MREEVEKRLFNFSIILSYLLAYAFVVVNPNIDKFNPTRFAIFLAILIGLYIIYSFAQVIRIQHLIRAVMVLAVFGMLISGYLAYAHYNSASGLCPPMENGAVPCDIVNKSIYSEFANIPISVFGLLGYFAFLCLAFMINNRHVYARKNHLFKKYERRMEAMLLELYLTYFQLELKQCKGAWCWVEVSL